MGSTGIRRKVDDLGRIVIPAELRRTLGLEDGSLLEVSLHGNRIVLALPSDQCVICGADDVPLRPVRDRTICGACAAEAAAPQTGEGVIVLADGDAAASTLPAAPWDVSS